MVVYSLGESSRLVIGGRYTVEVVEIGPDSVTLSITDLDSAPSDGPETSNPRVVQIARRSDSNDFLFDDDAPGFHTNELACMANAAN